MLSFDDSTPLSWRRVCRVSLTMWRWLSDLAILNLWWNKNERPSTTQHGRWNPAWQKPFHAPMLFGVMPCPKLRGKISNTRMDALIFCIFPTVCLSQHDSHPHFLSNKRHCKFRVKQYSIAYMALTNTFRYCPRESTWLCLRTHG
jgi:hypothetical protein